MTQPTNVDMSFDTSLIDLSPHANISFSTTESDPSDTTPNTNTQPANQPDPSSSKPAIPSPLPSEGFVKRGANSKPQEPSVSIQHLPTREAYNQWSTVYDTDGNMLQALDDLEVSILLPRVTDMVNMTFHGSAPFERPLHFLDLGCGTGRNTEKLVREVWLQGTNVHITGLDFSAGMLAVAERKLKVAQEDVAKRDEGKEGWGSAQVRLETTDCFPTVENAKASPVPDVRHLSPMDAVICTLVLEHIPLAPFFATLGAVLRPGGYALVTNMHADMGRVSQAGFVNADGVKVRGESFAHTVQETMEEAGKQGFDVVMLKERRVEEEDVRSGRVGERGRKWIGVNVWYGMILRKVDPDGVEMKPWGGL